MVQRANVFRRDPRAFDRWKITAESKHIQRLGAAF